MKRAYIITIHVIHDSIDDDANLKSELAQREVMYYMEGILPSNCMILNIRPARIVDVDNLGLDK